jgi:hypothetical protein
MSKKFVLFVILLIASIYFLQDVSAVSAECTDSDGRDYSIMGTLVYNGKSYTDRCYENDARYVLEYYCDASSIGKSEWKLCSGGCINGACQGSTTTCTPNWQASAWSTCTNNSQTRTYTDANNCGVTTGKPANETQNCNSSSVLVNIYGNGFNGANGPLSINNGSNTITISWNSSGADYCSASDSLGYSFTGNKGTSGSESVNIPTTGGSYIYTIKCFTSSGSFMQANLTVNVLTPKVTLVVTGPTTVVEGGSTTITWTSENSSFCRGESGTGFTGNLSSTSGSKDVTFNYNPHIFGPITVRYTISCTGYNAETVTAFAEVEVLPIGSTPVDPLPTADIKANGSDIRITIKKGQPLTLSWESNTGSCEIYSYNLNTGSRLYIASGQSGSKVIDTLNKAGQEISYSVSCIGGGGNAVAGDELTVNFSSENYSTIDLKINNSNGPVNLPLYSSLADISWTTFGNVSSCTASCVKDNSWNGSKSSSGGSERVGNFSSLGEYNYIISCATPVGNISDSVLVNVSSTTVDLKADNSNGPLTIVSGNRVQLSWTTNQANSCTASGDTSWTGSKSASGGPIYSDYIFSTKTYTLTCKDALNNTVVDSVVVNVSSNDCTPNWQLGSWSACLDNRQIRSYTDVNNCGVTTGKPADESQNCGSCTPNWTCTAWSTCSNSSQARTCTDSNYCGVTTNKPAETQNCTVTASCTDSDNGKDITIKGTLIYRGITYTDKCDAKYPTYVLEYYCDSTGIGKSEWGSCPGGCLDGVCKQSSDVCARDVQQCADGSWVSRIAPGCDFAPCPDVCTPNWQLQDYWSDCVYGMQSKRYIDLNRCETNKDRPADEIQSCGVNCYPDWTCTAWSTCLNSSQARTCTDIRYCGVTTGNKPAETQSCTVTATCTDSDNGKDFLIKGILNYRGITYTDRCDAKYPTYVLEYYCDSTGIGKSEWGSCPGGCLDGVCKGASNCVPNWQPGSWSVCENGTSGRQTRSYIDSNNCGVTTGKPADEVKDCSTQQSCSTNKNCQDRYQNCYYTCSDNQCAQINILVALKPYPDCSTVSVCTPNWQASAWSTCTNNIQTRTYTDANSCGVTTGKPANETQSCTVSATCTDSDNGKDLAVKGTLIYRGITYTDKCDSRYPTYVLEYYCDSTGVGKSEWGSCPGGCLDGVCKSSSSSNFVCQDESSGISYDMKDLATSLGQTITQVTTETCSTLFSLIKIFNQ